MDKKFVMALTLGTISITTLGVAYYLYNQNKNKNENEKKKKKREKELQDLLKREREDEDIFIAESLSLEEFNNREKLIREQDEAYFKSLFNDRNKDQVKKQIEDRLIQEEEEVKRQENLKLGRLREILLNIPSEPPTGRNDTTTIIVVLPGGIEIRRRFSIYHKLKDIKDYVDTRYLEETENIKSIPEDYIFVTDFPWKEFKDFNITLTEAGFTGRGQRIRVHNL